MKIINTEYFTKLLAEPGMVICSTDDVWTQEHKIKEVDLGIGDNIENYFEMPEIVFYNIEEEDNGNTEG